MDLNAFRLEKGKFYRKIELDELQLYGIYVKNPDGVTKRAITPPADVIGVVLDETDPVPVVEFVYSAKAMAEKYGRPRYKKPARMTLPEFVSLFAEGGKLQPPVTKGPKEYPGDTTLPLGSLPKPYADLAEMEACRKWEEISKDFCLCEKDRIIEDIKMDRKELELQRALMMSCIVAYDSYSNMLYEQLDRRNVRFVMDMQKGSGKGDFILEKLDPSVATDFSFPKGLQQSKKQ